MTITDTNLQTALFFKKFKVTLGAVGASTLIAYAHWAGFPLGLLYLWRERER
jgi:hypothetical protein